jgi:hypothetical protein
MAAAWRNGDGDDGSGEKQHGKQRNRQSAIKTTNEESGEGEENRRKKIEAIMKGGDKRRAKNINRRR